MTDKVLGFLKKDAMKTKGLDGQKYLRIYPFALVPVRLKSESVSLEWLEYCCNAWKEDTLKRLGYIKIPGGRDYSQDFLRGRLDFIDKMLAVAQKEAKK